MKKWLTGGIIGLVVGVIYFIFTLGILASVDGGPASSTILKILFYIPILFFRLLGGGLLLGAFLWILIFFGIGALIGWLIEKNKK